MRKLAIVVVVLLALGVAADRVAAYVAEGVIAQKIEDEEDVSEAGVEITGFPFLTQLLANEFGAIEVTLPTVQAATGVGRIQVDELDVVFRDVVTSDGFSRATAGSLTGSGSIPYDSFDVFDRVSVGYGGATPDGEGSLEITIERPDGSPGPTVRLQPSVAEGRSLGFLDASGEPVGAGLPGALAAFATGDYPLAGLPSGFRIDDVEVTPDGLRLTVTGTDVPLA